jgi:diaminohydroxyphosphoribosylaminopyrimidine deaminase/5-amino-6-(5-phosphoribosylamino)uracil reductase
MMRDDAYFMRQAVRLGYRGVGRTSPNPPVGAVVVRAGKVIARGFHARAGGAHAEAVALHQAGERARGATMYVTLEPCAHYGRTPPCTVAVRRAGLRRVVIGAPDPNPLSGRGTRELRRAGIEVVVGVERERCEELLIAFRKQVGTGLPFVTLKLAASMDGRIATRAGRSKWITGSPARALVHRLRDQNDAVLVGVDTVLRDDPALTCRRLGGRDPLRVVLDRRLRIPEGARVLRGAAATGTLIATAVRRGAKLQRLRARGVRIATVSSSGVGVSLRAVLRTLVRAGLSSVLIEGGAAVAASALRAKLVDRLVLFYAPKLIGGDGRAMVDSLSVNEIRQTLPLADLRIKRLGPDLVVFARPVHRSMSKRA